MAKAKKKYLEVRPGDIVTVHIKHGNDKHPFDARVTSVHDRGPVNPLIYYERLDERKEDSRLGHSPICDNSFVTRIVTRAPFTSEATHVNIFTERHLRCLNYKVGGVRIGSIESLIEEALASAKHVTLPFPLARFRARQLYWKDNWPGLVVLPEMPYATDHIFGSTAEAVHWKVFRRWVHKNALRLIETKAECHERIRKENWRRDETWKTIAHDMDQYEEEMDRREEEYFEDEPHHEVRLRRSILVAPRLRKRVHEHEARIGHALRQLSRSDTLRFCDELLASRMCVLSEDTFFGRFPLILPQPRRNALFVTE